MFNNLIESSSHSREFRRRGSFVLFTTTAYVLLFIVAGVISIYAYDARLEEPASEITMLSPADVEPPKPEPVRPVTAPPSGANHGGSGFVRENPTASVDESRLPPNTTSVTANTNPPLPPGVPFTIRNYNLNPGGVGPGTSGGGSGGNSSGGTTRVDVGTPPPAPIEKSIPQVIHKPVINGEALSLPKPPYPPIAKQHRIQGTVNVQVLIDETGKVISAKAVSGNPALMDAAQRAAFGARFSPTMIGDQAMKVSGVIIYNFVLQ